MKSSINKSYLAPKADKVASDQLHFLILNSFFTVIINDYKSNFVELENLRSLALKNNGFCYHPNKNVKIRSLEGFSTVLSPVFLNGLVVFAFFGNYLDVTNFLKLSSNINKLSYFSLLINGHIVEKKILSVLNLSMTRELIAFKAVSVLNENCFKSPLNLFYLSINKIYLVLNAYIKSIN